ncbi:MAG: hypothetical protein L0Z51_05455 [Candidatus Latescibacteria bacterium]|nr:hypothetical protein [Candidatus Latescibacterota bacterium]
MIRIRWCQNLLAATLVLVWALAGCDNATDADTANDVSSREQTVDLDDTYGGFNTADEAPAFDDPMLLSDYGPDGDVAYIDDVDTTHTDRRHPRRYLMITWGNLRCDSLVDVALDWTGGLCAENGVIRVVRTIRFERRDYLEPRTSRECVEWVSHTKPHFDGVIVALYKTMDCDSLVDPAVVDTLCDRPLSVTFKTGPLTITFSEDELSDLHRVIPVDDAGNAVAFNVITRRPDACANGFLAGQWKPSPGRNAKGVQGWFRGKWVSENGLHMGYLRGFYGIRAHDERVFFGKWVSESGRFRGLLTGHYGLLEETDTNAQGWFEGVWFSRQLRSMGGLEGVWGTGDDDKEGGFFRGVWRERCAPAAL